MTEKTKSEAQLNPESMQLSLLPAHVERNNPMTPEQSTSVLQTQTAVATPAPSEQQNSPDPTVENRAAQTAGTATPQPPSAKTASTLAPSKPVTAKTPSPDDAPSDTTCDTKQISQDSAITTTSSTSVQDEAQVKAAPAQRERVETPVAQPSVVPQAQSAAPSPQPAVVPQAQPTVAPQAQAAAPSPQPAVAPQVQSAAPAAQPANSDKGKDFEAALSELEKIVGLLEGEVKLEDALKLFDRGMNLSQHCQECLVDAEQRIDILKRAINGSLTSEKFNEDQLQ